MGAPHKDLTGERFGRWTVMGRGEARDGKLFWRCRCDCGWEYGMVSTYALKSGLSRSCGCLRREVRRRLMLEDNPRRREAAG